MQNAVKQSHLKRLLETSLMKFALGAALFFGSAVIFGLLALNLVIKHGQKVAVPNVVNKSIVEALDLLSQRGLELKKTGARNSSSIPENFVLSQDPLPGSSVKSGSAVAVSISLGSKIALVPNLSGRPLREAQAEVNSSGLKVGRLSRIHHGKAADTVLAQFPAANEQVNRDTTIDMLVSLGPVPLEFRTPDFTGFSLEQASRTLKAMGIELGDIVTKVDYDHQPGTVLKQDPQPGGLLHQGETVSLVVSSLHREGTRPERKYAVYIYQIPYGFTSKAVRIEVSDPEGTRVVYDETDEPGAGVRVVFAYSEQCTVRVYLDGVLETERIMR